MAKAGRNSDSTRKIRPALSPEARENQLISLAVDNAEKMLLNGTAPAQIITHFLKLGTAKAELEKEKLRQDNELTKAKIEAIHSGQRMEELYANAIKAMSRYQGRGGASDDEEWN